MPRGSSSVVLITGCSNGGIGFYLCEAFAERGCAVYATARRMEAMAGFVHPEIRKLVLDVNDEENIKKVVDTIIEREGRIDILISNAGIQSAGPILDMEIERAKEAFDTNYFAVIRMAKEVVPYMATRKQGLVINVGSISSDIPTPFMGNYSASKAAVHNISELLAMECRPLGVKVMLLQGGTVATNIDKNAENTYVMPENSLYRQYLSRILNRNWVTDGAMSGQEFAKRVVKKVLVRNPPAYLKVGGKVALMNLLLWLPRQLALWIVWKIASGR
ncbi:hypothetical protein BOTBODRAFT_29961 [Botryobasidium botryosum FD-172 SS1]|uniref:Oxidoreductase n=1 Tax=Botryobasidium botryosum (strain FD-172 SS1) TaxID=930990 RepID=A0A067N116_BOTB1|nr:hypothetical protein BOTBODRAFT_29961 [Botryobasidium botryosum FD-172 SS1]